MKTKIIIKMFAGILIGILATLFLTLNYWGSETGKVILSIALGVIIGMFIADFKLSVQIFKNTGIAAWTFFVECFNKICSINLNPKKVSKMTWIRRYFRVSILIKFLIFMALPCGVIFIGCSGFPKGFGIIIGLSFLHFIILALFCAMSLMFSCGIGTAIDFCEKRERRIWKKSKVFYAISIEEGFSFKDTCNIAASKGISFIEKKSLLTYLHLNLFLLFIIFRVIKGIIVIGGLIILCFAISLLLSTFLLPFWFLRELWKHKKLLVVALSIVAGGIIGTYYESYLYGILTGFSVATISLLLERFLPEAKFFFYWKRLFANDDLWKKIWLIV